MERPIEELQEEPVVRGDFLTWEIGIGMDLDVRLIMRLYEEELHALRRELYQRKRADSERRLQSS